MEIKIGGQIFKIIEKDIEKDESEDASGYVKVASGKIFINSKMNKDQKDSTLIHEILEAINIMYELKLKHNQISILESTLYQVFKDNKIIN